MRSEAEIREALHTMIRFFDSSHGGAVPEESFVQFVGYMSAMSWCLGEVPELLEECPGWPGNDPNYHNPINTLILKMRERLKEENKHDRS